MKICKWVFSMRTDNFLWSARARARACVCVCVCVKLNLSRISIEHHTVKEYNWSGHSDVLCILNHRTRWRSVVSCPPRPHYPRDPLCPFLRGKGGPEPVWTIWKQESVCVCVCVCVCHYLQLLKLFEQATAFSSPFPVKWLFVYSISLSIQ